MEADHRHCVLSQYAFCLMLTQYSHRRSLAKKFIFESSYNRGTVQDVFSGYLREESAQIASSLVGGLRLDKCGS
jgi:hypothetical protein